MYLAHAQTTMQLLPSPVPAACSGFQEPLQEVTSTDVCVLVMDP